MQPEMTHERFQKTANPEQLRRYWLAVEMAADVAAEFSKYLATLESSSTEENQEANNAA